MSSLVVDFLIVLPVEVLYWGWLIVLLDGPIYTSYEAASGGHLYCEKR